MRISDWSSDVCSSDLLALANRVVVVDGLAAADAGEDYVFFVVAVGGNQDRHRLPDLFLGGIAEEPLRAAVPACGDAVEVLADDGVVRRLDDGGQALRRRLRGVAQRDVVG